MLNCPAEAPLLFKCLEFVQVFLSPFWRPLQYSISLSELGVILLSTVPGVERKHVSLNLIFTARCFYGTAFHVNSPLRRCLFLKVMRR